MAAILMAFVLAAPVTAASIANSGFEDPVMSSNFQIIPNEQSFGAWEVINNSVLMLRSDYYEFYGGPQIPFVSHAGNQHLDISGAGNTGNAGVQQWIDTDPGSWYRLSFWVGNQDNDSHAYYTQSSSIRLLIDGDDLGTFTNADSTVGAMNWKLFSYRFMAQNALTLVTFVNATSGDNMAGLDDVSIAHTPEPSTWVMIVSSGLLMLLARSRRLQAAQCYRRAASRFSR